MKGHISQPHGLALTPEFYSSIVKHGSDLITVLDKEGNYLFTSDSVSTIMGYTTEDLLGTNVMNLVHPEDLPQVQAYYYSLLGGENTQMSLPPSATGASTATGTGSAAWPPICSTCRMYRAL